MVRPISAPRLNAVLRKTTFSEPMLAEWKRHQIEEVSMLNHYLPQLYAQRGGGYHFRRPETQTFKTGAQ